MKYTKAEGSRIVDQYLGGLDVPLLSFETGVPRSTIYTWIKSYDQNISNTDHIISRKEYSNLTQRVARLDNMVKVLKSVRCTVSSPLQEKLNAIESLHGQFSVHILCEALEVARGTYYNHIFRNKRDDTIYAKNQEELRSLIKDIFDEYEQVMGAGKIHAILRERGYRTSERTVQSLMQEMGLRSISATSKRDYIKWQKGENKNVLQQRFLADKPNRAWVSDVTTFRFNEAYYFTCVIIDLYSRKVISYKTSKKNSTQLVTKTFRSAYALRCPEKGLIFHSDRGAAYVSFAFQNILKERGIVQSFSRSGRPHDNAVSESFFSYMKKEELYRRKYKSEKEFLQGIDAYISFYNEKRPHSTLQYKTPEKMEENVGNKPI